MRQRIHHLSVKTLALHTFLFMMREKIVHYVCAVKAINYMPHCTYVTNLHIYEQPFIVQLLPCLHIANLGNVNKSKDN